MKALKIGGVYQKFVETHANAPTGEGFHENPWFLPWHRRFLLEYEAAIQDALDDPDFGLPYWDAVADWTMASTGGADLTDAETSMLARNAAVWGNDCMGSGLDDTIVSTGPFAYWPTTTPKGQLERQFGTVDAPSLPNQKNVTDALELLPYDSAPWSADSTGTFRNELEKYVHNVIHLWVGGSMAPITSPNDPIFFLHHCNMDRIFALWQDNNPSMSYLPAAGTGKTWDADKPMWPWDGTKQSDTVTPQDMWDYSDLGYTYGQRWPGPVFTPEWIPMTPVTVDAPADWTTEWPSGLLAPGWTVHTRSDEFNDTNQGIYRLPNHDIDFVNLHVESWWEGTIYLCLTGPGAGSARPILYANSKGYYFSGWQGNGWSSDLATPIGTQDYYWYKLESPPRPLSAALLFYGDPNDAFWIWGYTDSSTVSDL